MKTILLSVLAISLTAISPLHAQGTLPSIDPERISEVASWLNSEPDFFTPTFSERAFWDAVGKSYNCSALFAEADKALATPPPVLTEALFGEIRITGRREGYEKPFADRSLRLGFMLFAEGLSNNGRYLPGIQRELEAILDEPSWAVPLHARKRPDWKSARDLVDLAAAARAWDLALADYLLGDKLPLPLRTRIREEVRARVLTPYLKRVRLRDREDFWWMNGTNNWNAVCNGGVVAAALLLRGAEPPAVSREEAAELIASYEALIPFYLSAFGTDGFCDEGFAYWKYGYGHFTISSEVIRLATRGQLDLLQGKSQRLISTFDRRWEIDSGIYPLFGDAFAKTTIPVWLHDFATMRYEGTGGILAKDSRSFPIYRHSLGAHLYTTCFDLSLKRPPSNSAEAKASLQLRDWFPDGGALVLRRNSSEPGLSVALNGGNNGRSHNHNDLGSFVVVYKGEAILADLGADTYVKDTFSSKRYTSEVTNSFGHPVPMVAGQLQRPGRDARAVTKRSDFTPERDIWEMEMTSAYAVPDLHRLTRTFLFDRNGMGKLEILDTVEFKPGKSGEFGTALIIGKNQRTQPNADGSLIILGKNGALHVQWLASQKGEWDGSHLAVNEKPIHGFVAAEGSHGTRIGLDFPEPVEEASIRIVITPIP